MNRSVSIDSSISDLVYADDYDDGKQHNRPNDYFPDDWNSTKDSDPDSNKIDENARLFDESILKNPTPRFSNISTESFRRGYQSVSDIEPSNAGNLTESGDSLGRLLPEYHALPPVTDPLVDDADLTNLDRSYERTLRDYQEYSDIEPPSAGNLTELNDAVERLRHKFDELKKAVMRRIPDVADRTNLDASYERFSRDHLDRSNDITDPTKISDDSIDRLSHKYQARGNLRTPSIDVSDRTNLVRSYERFPRDHLDRSNDNTDPTKISDDSIEYLRTPLIDVADPMESVTFSSILDKAKKDDHDDKALFIRLLQFLLILLLFTGVDFSLRVASNVDYNKDPSIISTYCYRAMVIKIENEHKFSQTSVDDSGFLIRTWNYFTAQMTRDEFYQAKMKNFQAYKAYRERNIKFETDQIWVFYVMAAISFIFIAAVIYGESNSEPVFVTVSWVFFCLSMASIIFIFIHICRLRYDPIKFDDCPTFKPCGKTFCISYKFI